MEVVERLEKEIDQSITLSRDLIIKYKEWLKSKKQDKDRPSKEMIECN